MEKNRIVLPASGKCFDMPLYRAWTDKLSLPCTYIQEYDISWQPPADTGLIVTAQHYMEPDVSIIRNAVKNNIPVLIITDGILEYKNTWERPDTTPGSIFQPVLGHKIACIGRAQARILESWGNLGKCEVVGLPRLDRLAQKKLSLQSHTPFRFLVTTARVPGFTAQQTSLIKKSLKDLKEWLDTQQSINGKPFEVIWRLTENMDSEIGVESRVEDTTGTEFAKVIQSVDALITTPSTTMLEGMLNGIPVAVLDYANNPLYTQSAWTISAGSHIPQVIPELIDPPAPKMLFQNMVLHDNLECVSPATDRMVTLAEEMVKIANTYRSQNKPVEFPARILPDIQYGHHMPETSFDMHQLYPGHPVFANVDTVALQVEVEHLTKAIKEKEQLIQDLHNHIRTSNQSAQKTFLHKIRHAFPGPRKIVRLTRQLFKDRQ